MTFLLLRASLLAPILYVACVIAADVPNKWVLCDRSLTLAQATAWCDAGADVNAVRSAGMGTPWCHTPLHSAVCNTTEDGLEIAELLVSRGADVNARNENGATPFCLLLRYTSDMSLEKIKRSIGVFLSHNPELNVLCFDDSCFQTPLYRMRARKYVKEYGEYDVALQALLPKRGAVAVSFNAMIALRKGHKDEKFVTFLATQPRGLLAHLTLLESYAARRGRAQEVYNGALSRLIGPLIAAGIQEPDPVPFLNAMRLFKHKGNNYLHYTLQACAEAVAAVCNHEETYEPSDAFKPFVFERNDDGVTPYELAQEQGYERTITQNAATDAITITITPPDAKTAFIAETYEVIPRSPEFAQMAERMSLHFQRIVERHPVAFDRFMQS